MADIVLGLLSKFISPKSPQKVAIIVLILHVWRQRLREVRHFAQKHTAIQEDITERETGWQWMDGRWYILSHLNGLRWLAKWFCTVCYWPWNGHCWFKGLNGIQILSLIRFLAICLMIFAFNDNDSFILIIDMVISNSKMALYVGGKISCFRIEQRTFYYKDWWKKWSLNGNFLLWISVKFL